MLRGLPVGASGADKVGGAATFTTSKWRKAATKATHLNSAKNSPEDLRSRLAKTSRMRSIGDRELGTHNHYEGHANEGNHDPAPAGPQSAGP